MSLGGRVRGILGQDESRREGVSREDIPSRCEAVREGGGREGVWE